MVGSGSTGSLEAIRRSTPGMPGIGLLIATAMAPAAPGAIVAAGAVAVTPQVQNPPGPGSRVTGSIRSGLLPLLVKTKRYATSGPLLLTWPKSWLCSAKIHRGGPTRPPAAV